MKHLSRLETRSALPIEMRSADSDPLAAATAAVDELRTANTEFRTSIDLQLAEIRASLADLDLHAQRPGSVTETRAAEIERRALASFMRTGSDAELRAAAGTDDNAAGAWFTLPTIDSSIRQLLTEISPMRSLAEVVTTNSGAYERFYSLGKRGASWVSERDDRPQDTARPELIKHRYESMELYAAPVTTRHLLDDASIDIANWLIQNAVHDFSVTEGEAFLSADGVGGKPRGLLDYGTTNEADFARAWGKHQYVPAGHASAPTDDNLAKALVALMMTLRAQYRPNARWLMNRTTGIRLRQIQDTAKRFMWAPEGNLLEGEQAILLGFPVTYDDNMPNIGENTHPVAFGDFRQGYVIVDRHGIRMNRDELTRKGSVVFDTYKRVGGGAGDFNAIKFLKVAAS